MKFQNYFKKVIVLSFAVILMSYSASFAAVSNDYSFKVTNRTDTKIKKLLASEDGEKYGFFDIGSGLGAGKSMTLVWDKSTDEAGCAWYFKAVYADDSESEPVAFDFCEENLELVFD
jgi:hypothetical protein